jgi:hypothetical protein
VELVGAEFGESHRFQRFHSTPCALKLTPNIQIQANFEAIIHTPGHPKSTIEFDDELSIQSALFGLEIPDWKMLDA